MAFSSCTVKYYKTNCCTILFYFPIMHYIYCMCSAEASFKIKNYFALK